MLLSSTFYDDVFKYFHIIILRPPKRSIFSRILCSKG